MAVNLFFVFLAVSMVVTGTINTITTKYADITSAKGIDGTKHQFDHPFFQAAGMFLGELLCLITFYLIMAVDKVRGKPPPERTKFNPLLLALPACCDMTGTSLMYLGLTYTYASVFQMLRGSVVIFTGIFSMIFLKRKLKLYHWTGMLLVLFGLGFVGLSSVLVKSTSNNAPHPLLGDVIIVCAQIITATQMVVEEKFIGRYNIPPLQVVGLEGLFGLSILSIVLVIMYHIPGSSAGNHFENSLDAFVQIGNSWIILLAILGNIFSIAFFNFFGISITKYSSATTRMVMDSIRTVLIWGFSLIVGWQGFDYIYLQIIGFVLLLLGTVIYNEVLVIPFLGVPEQQQGYRPIDQIEDESSVNKP